MFFLFFYTLKVRFIFKKVFFRKINQGAVYFVKNKLFFNIFLEIYISKNIYK